MMKQKRWKPFDKPENIINNVREMFAAYIGSMTVPIRTVGDIVPDIIEEERPYRQTRGVYPEWEEGWKKWAGETFAPAISNVPGLRQMLPPSYSVYAEEEKPFGSEPDVLFGLGSGAVRQATGLSMRRLDPLQQEVSKHGIWGVYPKTTGDRYLDNVIRREVGNIIAEQGKADEVLQPAFQNLPDFEKVALIKKWFKIAHGAAKKRHMEAYVNEILKQRGIRAGSFEAEKIRTQYGIGQYKDEVLDWYEKSGYTWH
jgi:hypothetical protein